MTRTIILATAIVVSLLGPSPARAEDAKAEAKAAYEKALRYFQAEEYELALPYFQRAYELSGKRPSTIMALAQCERMLHRYDDALNHYAEFLASKPSDAERKSVQETIALVKELQAHEAAKAEAARKKREEEAARRAAAAPPPVAPPPPQVAPPAVTTTPEEEDSILASPVLWIVVGSVVVVGAAVGIGVGVATGGDDVYGGTKGVVARPLLGRF